MKERGNAFLRFVDRSGGIPLIYALSLFKRRPNPFPAPLQTIALLKTAGIGDTALLTGPILDIKKAVPKAKITLFTGTSNGEMGKMIEGINTVSLPMTRPIKALKLIRQKPFDVFIDFDPWPRINALLAYFSRSKATLGFQTEGEFRHRLYDQVILHKKCIHELQNYRALISLLEIPPHHLPMLNTHSTPIENKIALHVFPGGSRATLKMWPEKKWATLAKALIGQGYEVIFTGSSQDKNALNSLVKQIDSPRAINSAGLSLEQTARLLKRTKALVTVDTGIAHLGAALGCRVISLHGPTSPKRWGAIGKNVTTLTPPYPYWPCISLGFEKTCSTNQCMQAIEVERVLQAIS